MVLSIGLLCWARRADAQPASRPAFRCANLPIGVTERRRTIEVEPQLEWSSADDLRAWLAEVRWNGVEWAVRRCYRQMLVRVARVSGSLTFTVAIDAGGAMRVTATAGPAALAPLRDCLVARAGRVRTRTPPTRPTTLHLRVTFIAPPGTELHEPEQVPDADARSSGR